MATTQTSYDVISIGERAAEGEDDRVYVRLRADLDIGAFGASAAHQKKAGEPVVPRARRGRAGVRRARGAVRRRPGPSDLHGRRRGDRRAAGHGRLRPQPGREAEGRRRDRRHDRASPSAAGAARHIASARGRRSASSSACTARRTTRARWPSAEKALETYPGNAFILYNVACLENLLGRPDDALATLGTAIEELAGVQGDCARGRGLHVATGGPALHRAGGVAVPSASNRSRNPRLRHPPARRPRPPGTSGRSRMRRPRSGC